MHPLDRVFWMLLRPTWSRWKDALVIVRAETVVGWHRSGFRLYWRWKSRPRGGAQDWPFNPDIPPLAFAIST